MTADQMNSEQPEVHYRTCNLCEAMCGLEIEHKDGNVLSIKGDKQDTFSNGFICPKAVALQDIYNDPDRLRQPVKRVNDEWQKIGWDEALREVSQRLLSIKKKYGNKSVGIYQGNPTVHNYGTMLFMRNLTKALGIRNKFSATSVDQLPHHMASQYMFGHNLLIPIPDIDRTDFFLIIGANPVVSNGSLMTAAGMPGRLRDLQKRGGKVVVIDPRKTETAAKADQHLFIKPGTDTLLLLGLLHVIVRENTANPGRLAGHIQGLESIDTLTVDFSPEDVSSQTGIEADRIRQLAQDFSKATSAVCYGRMGVSTQQYGTLCQWLINVLNIVTGNFDRSGGALFNTPAVDIVKLLGSKGTLHKYNRWQSGVRGLPEFDGELPSVTMAEEILENEDGIKAMITSAGNPVLSVPNGKKLEEAFRKLDFMVSVDIYINETTRHADIILPPTTGLETDHYDLIFNLFAVRNVAKYSPALFSPDKSAMADWQIFKALANHIKPQKNPLKKLMDRWSTPQRLLDLALKMGSYGRWHKGFRWKGLTLAKLKRRTHGLDLGPLSPSLPHRLFTKDKKINMAPDLFLEDIERLKRGLVETGVEQKFDLLLIGRRQLRSNNSWMHNSHRLVKGGDRCTLMMHPADVRKNKLNGASNVRIESQVGSIEVGLEESEDMLQGVVSLPHGWGHNRRGIKMKIAAEHSGQSINDIIDHSLVDTLSGNAAVNGVPVRVEAV